MSTRTIRKIITSTVAPDSVTLLSLTRDDTGAEVQASGVNIAPVAFTLASTVGNVRTYEVTFTEPAEGLSYHYSYQVVSGADQITDDGVLTVDLPAGTYADSSDLDDFYGVENVTAYSDLADADTRDNARIQKFLDYADDWINLAFKQVGRTTPIPSDADDFSTLTRIAAEWAGAMLAKGRGDLPDKYKGDAFDSFMDGHIERAQAALQSLVDSWLELNPDLDTEPVVAMQAIVPVQEQRCNYPWGWMQ